MAGYKIDWSSDNSQGIYGKEPIFLNQKTINTSDTSLPLTGKGVNNYGEIQQENFLRLMEHFASNVPPSNPTIGQMWFNPEDIALYICAEIDKSPGFDFYYPNYPIAWLKVFPGAGGGSGGGFEAASFAQYQELAIEINRILGVPTSYNPGSSPLANPQLQWGWGQTDLVPVYSSLTSLAPGFLSYGFPSTFSNESWIILLSRLRKALRQVGISESATSPVGFRNDGKPISGSNTIANTYNAYPTPGTLPNYSNGWAGLDINTVQAHYSTTLNLINQLKNNRFNLNPASSNAVLMESHNFPSSWNSTQYKTFSAYFTSYEKAKAFFNAGGHFKFKWSHSPSVNDSFNLSWQNFLNQTTDLIFDYTGVKHGTTYKPSAIGSPESVGFYDLTPNGPGAIVYEGVRSNNQGGIYDGGVLNINDGGIRILVSSFNGDISGTPYFSIAFFVQFIEQPAVGETVQGTSNVQLWAHKASITNTNTPGIELPTITNPATPL